jgi:uncharacterized protein
VPPYQTRVVDTELDELLAGLAAISLEGPKGVGKTATAQRRAHTTFALDDPVQRELIAADPQRLETAVGPVLIDEWQRHPYVWDLVRRSVDRDYSPARFLLTGSATPTSAPTHSGAGRIVRLRMRPMSLAERAVAAPSVSLTELLSGRRPSIGGSSELSLPDYTEEIVKSGFPAVRTLPARVRRAQLDGYLARIVEHDFPEQGHPVRRPGTLRAWLAAYASATATTSSYNTILDAATPGDADKPAKTTTIAYRDVLTQLWLLDPISGWSTSRSTFTQLSAAPKHNLADPALAARLLGVDVDALLSGSADHPGIHAPGPLLGAFFESLVALSVQTYAQAAEASVHHLRTRDGRREVDLIVQRGDRRIVAFEVKLTPSVNDDDVRHLNWLQWQLGDDLLDAAVITTGPEAYRRPDGIAVVPAALLGP